MEIRPLNIGYLEGAHVVTVTLCAKDSSGYSHPIQAQWPADEVPELASLVRKAIEQVGGDLALHIDDANAAIKAQPQVEPASAAVNLAKDTDLRTQVESRKQELIKEREEIARRLEEERLAAEAALNNTEGVE